MNEVEAVARAVASLMEGGREFDQMPPTRIELRQWARSGMCSTNDATQDDATALAQAAIAALDAARGDAEPAMTTPEQIAAGMSEDELLDEFRALFNWRGRKRLTAKQWAAEHGFSQAYVSDVLRGNRGIADRFAGEIGYQRVVIFVPATRNTGEPT